MNLLIGGVKLQQLATGDNDCSLFSFPNFLCFPLEVECTCKCSHDGVNLVFARALFQLHPLFPEFDYPLTAVWGFEDEHTRGSGVDFYDLEIFCSELSCEIYPSFGEGSHTSESGWKDAEASSD